MITPDELAEFRASLDFQQEVDPDLAMKLYESFITSARLVDKHHRGINACPWCGFDPLVRKGEEEVPFDYDDASRDYEYGFTASNDPNAPEGYVHSPSDTREAVEYLWGPEARNELRFGTIVKREKAGPWRKA